MPVSESKPADNNRILWIDAVKGFTAVLVVLGHNLMGMLDEGMFVSGTEAWTCLVNWIYSFHMILFFFVSGYLFCRSYIGRDLQDAEIKRKYRVQLQNLVIVYFFFSILLWLSRYVLSSHVVKQVSLRNLLLIPVRPLETYWYLWVLIFYYVTGFFLLRLSERTGGRVFGLWLALTLLLSFVSDFLPVRRPFGILRKAAYYSVGFIFGAWCYKNDTGFLRKKNVVRVLAISSAAVSCAILFAGWDPRSIPAVNTLTALLLTACIVSLFQTFADRPGRICMMFAKTGSYALEIYLLQTYVIGADRRLVRHFAGHASVPVILLCVCLETGIPMFAGWVLKKLNLHKPVFRPASWIHEKLGN